MPPLLSIATTIIPGSHLGGSVAGLISGFAYPGETLSMEPGAASYQWYVDAADRGTAQTLVLTVDDIGKTVTGIRNGITLPQKTVWKPQDVPGVQVFYWARAGVLASVSPDVAATNGQGVRAWVGQVSGVRAEQTTGSLQPTWQATGVSGGPSVFADGADDSIPLADALLGLLNNVTEARLFVGFTDTNPTGGDATHALLAFTTAGTRDNFAARLALVSRVGAGTFAATARRVDGESVNIAAGSTTDGQYHVHTAEGLYGAGILRYRMDGIQQAESAFASGAGPTSATNSGDARLFRIGAVNTTRAPGHMTVAFVQIGSITESNRSRLERFIGLHGGRNIPLV